MSEAVSDHDDHDEKHEVTITVNNKKVKIMGPKATGLQIKEAAIAQGVKIELDFELKEILGHKERKIIGDSDVVKIDNDSKFVATASDDNS